jgi:hypothetical protein
MAEPLAGVIDNEPAVVEIVPASVRVMSPSRNKSCQAAEAEPKSYESSLAGIRSPVGVQVVSQTGTPPVTVRTAPVLPTASLRKTVEEEA